jgi:hypothetical protein
MTGVMRGGGGTRKNREGNDGTKHGGGLKEKREVDIPSDNPSSNPAKNHSAS